MDGPELVPCEKLDPLPELGGGPLPRFCVYFAMVYYILVILGSIAVMIIIPKLMPSYVESGVWLETVLLSLFWSVLAVDMLVVFFCAAIGTVKNLCKNLSLTSTLQSLFPTVDAAIVDDYVYRSEAGRHIIILWQCW